MQIRDGNRAVLEQFIADGFSYMFGNPGTVEQGFLDALKDYPQLKYILTLQESVAVLMADGYARASKKPALVQIHSSPGLGNAIGAIYQAKRGHCPLVVIGGDAGVKYQAMDAQMAAELVEMAKPVCKYAVCVNDPSSLLRIIRRAVKIACTPPMGPVYICLPMDILDLPNNEDVFPSCIPVTDCSPAPEIVIQTAEWLINAQKPMAYIGDGIAFSKAQAEIAELAELLGMEIWEVNNGEVNVDNTSPMYHGATGHMFGYQSLPILQKGDVNLVCGTYIVPEVFPELGNVFNPAAKVIHFDLDSYEIAKNHPVTLGALADPKSALKALIKEVKTRLTPELIAKFKTRFEQIVEAKVVKRSAQLATYQSKSGNVPLQMFDFMQVLTENIPEEAVIFDEALTNSPPISFLRPPILPESYFLTRGGSLGVGFPGAIGVKLALPDKTVIAFSGDGGSMYTIQALWSAKRHNLNVKFIVCNNRSYHLLQLNISAYWQERELKPHDFPICFDMSNPKLDFVSMAIGLGITGRKVSKPEDIAPAIKEMMEHPGSFLIDLELDGVVHPELIGVHCGQ